MKLGRVRVPFRIIFEAIGLYLLGIIPFLLLLNIWFLNGIMDHSGRYLVFTVAYFGGAFHLFRSFRTGKDRVVRVKRSAIGAAAIYLLVPMALPEPEFFDTTYGYCHEYLRGKVGTSLIQKSGEALASFFLDGVEYEDARTWGRSCRWKKLQNESASEIAKHCPVDGEALSPIACFRRVRDQLLNEGGSEVRMGEIFSAWSAEIGFLRKSAEGEVDLPNLRDQFLASTETLERLSARIEKGEETERSWKNYFALEPKIFPEMNGVLRKMPDSARVEANFRELRIRALKVAGALSVSETRAKAKAEFSPRSYSGAILPLQEIVAEPVAQVVFAAGTFRDWAKTKLGKTYIPGECPPGFTPETSKEESFYEYTKCASSTGASIRISAFVAKVAYLDHQATMKEPCSREALVRETGVNSEEIIETNAGYSAEMNPRASPAMIVDAWSCSKKSARFSHVTSQGIFLKKIPRPFGSEIDVRYWALPIHFAQTVWNRAMERGVLPVQLDRLLEDYTETVRRFEISPEKMQLVETLNPSPDDLEALAFHQQQLRDTGPARKFFESNLVRLEGMLAAARANGEREKGGTRKPERRPSANVKKRPK